jgi:transcriptional regulator GlxA family with amidase domain
MPSRELLDSIKFLRANWQKPIGVGDLITVSALSRRGFQKSFLKHTGQNPGRALRRLRIERGKALLVATDHDLRVIAQKCGYRRLNSFWVAFRRTTGMSPGRYRLRFHQTDSRA